MSKQALGSEEVRLGLTDILPGPVQLNKALRGHLGRVGAAKR